MKLKDPYTFLTELIEQNNFKKIKDIFEDENRRPSKLIIQKLLSTVIPKSLQLDAYLNSFICEDKSEEQQLLEIIGNNGIEALDLMMLEVILAGNYYKFDFSPYYSLIHETYRSKTAALITEQEKLILQANLTNQEANIALRDAITKYSYDFAYKIIITHKADGIIECKGRPLIVHIINDQISNVTKSLMVCALMGNRIAVAAQDVNGMTPLHHIAKMSRGYKWINLLVSKGEKINARNQNNYTPLCLAVEENLPDNVLALIKAGAEVRYKSGISPQPVIIAAKSNTLNSLNIIRLLQQHGACNVEDYNNALIIACRNGCYEIAKFLIDNGASTNYVNKDGYTPLYAAIDAHSEHVTQLLINCEAKVNDKIGYKGSAIDYLYSFKDHFSEKHANIAANFYECAIKDDLPKTALFFIYNGFFPAFKFSDGKNVLIKCVIYKSREVLKVILHHNSLPGGVGLNSSFNVDERDNQYQCTALILAIKNKQKLIASDLLLAGARVNIVDSRGKSALHHAIYNDDIELARLLLQFGANPNLRTERINSPLRYAITHKSINFVTLMLKSENKFGIKADINERQLTKNAEDIDSLTLLHHAIIIDDSEIIKLLLQEGANPNVTCKYENYNSVTPLQLACITTLNHRNKVVGLLLDHGANTNAICKFYITPHVFQLSNALILSISNTTKEEQITELLLKNNIDFTGNSENNIALHCAITYKKLYLVEKLLNSRIDLSCEYAQKAINLDRLKEYPEVVSLLLKHSIKNGLFDVFLSILKNGASVSYNQLPVLSLEKCKSFAVFLNNIILDPEEQLSKKISKSQFNDLKVIEHNLTINLSNKIPIIIGNINSNLMIKCIMNNHPLIVSINHMLERHNNETESKVYLHLDVISLEKLQIIRGLPENNVRKINPLTSHEKVIANKITANLDKALMVFEQPLDSINRNFYTPIHAKKMQNCWPELIKKAEKMSLARKREI